MLYRLVVEKNGKRARVIQLRSPTARLGRARGNEIRIPSAKVSRRHCRLNEREGLLWVEDLESVNGTYLNGDLITGQTVVRPGDCLRIGPVTFIVEYDLTPDALERLRELDSDVAEEAEEEAVPEVEEAEDEDVPEVEEVLEADDYAPRADMDEVTWAPPKQDDMRDLLSHLDEGQESMLPRKRPAPRKPADRRPPKDEE